MTGQEHQQSDMNLLFPIAKPTDDADKAWHTDKDAAAGNDEQQGAQGRLGNAGGSAGVNGLNGMNGVADSDAPGGITADSSSIPAAGALGTGNAPASADEDGILPGDIVDTNWDIPLITFPMLDNEQSGEVSPISKIADISSRAPRTSKSTAGGPAAASGVAGAAVAGSAAAAAPISPSNLTAGAPQHRAGTKTEQWLNAARQDNNQAETQQFGAALAPSNIGTQSGVSNAALETSNISLSMPDVPGMTMPNPVAAVSGGVASGTAASAAATATVGAEGAAGAAGAQRGGNQHVGQHVGLQQPGPSLLTPPAPRADDIARERVANAETETMTPVSSAAVVAGTAAISAKVTAPGAAKTNATRTIHTPQSGTTGPQDAVGSLQEELVDNSVRQASGNEQRRAEEADDSPSSRGTKTRSRAIVVIFLIITIIAAGVGVYYLSGMVRTNRNRSNAYSNCTKAYSQVKENSETLTATLKSTAAQQKIGTDQVADVMTVEKLKTAVSKAKSASKPVMCKTSMSTDALGKAAETNQTLATQLVNLNSTVKAAAKDVKTSAKTKQTNDYNSAVDTLKTTTSEASTLLSNSQGVVADDNTRTTLQSAIDAANTLLQKDKPALVDVQKAQNDLQTASDAVNASMEEYKTQRAAADAAAAASAAAAQAQSQTQGQTQRQTQRQNNIGGAESGAESTKTPTSQPTPTKTPTSPDSPTSSPSESASPSASASGK
ncbi:hypothetical protein [Bifidobacterium thermophilum]|uniref:Sugar-binding protein n=1 Tax=Bifidobacterium thermophilum TaxID=33905 RepID=A0A7X9RN96_9BIFI|nr:hypothetical protein [Bifidobacterium thermophilum]NME62461.1 hypothetical protein [Bifidobacterium thermophilum]